jgi:hypothetical protein
LRLGLRWRANSQRHQRNPSPPQKLRACCKMKKENQEEVGGGGYL